MRLVYKMEKFLITGGAGYIGSILTEHLLEKKHSVTCLDNLSYHQRSLMSHASNPNFNFVYGDVRDEELLTSIVPEFSAIIPLAAIVGAPACKISPHDTRSINHDAVMLLNEIRNYDQKLIFPSTISVYGMQPKEQCTEESPLNPVSLYAEKKADSEKALVISDKDSVILRLATVFGASPRMRTDLLVNDFVMKAAGEGYLVLYEGHVMRNYIHVRDIARAFEHCIQNYEIMKNGIFNVGLKENFSKLDLAKKIKQHVPLLEIIASEIGEDVDKRDYRISSEKIERTGFTPIFSLDRGVEELIKVKDILLKNNPYKNI